MSLPPKLVRLRRKDQGQSGGKTSHQGVKWTGEGGRDLEGKQLQSEKLLGYGYFFDVKNVVIPALGTSETWVILKPTQWFFELCAATRSGAGEA